MENIIGQRAVLPDGPSEDEIMDGDLASPQFVSWTARREAAHLRDVVKTLPKLRELLPKAELVLNLIIELDDAIEGALPCRKSTGPE